MASRGTRARDEDRGTREAEGGGGGGRGGV